jgi:hypothetical protein
MTRLLVALAVIAVPTTARAAREIRCRTGIALAATGQRRAIASSLPSLAEGGKVMRDAFGRPPHARRSANFAVKWGDARPVDPAMVEAVLEMLEIAWRDEIDSMDLPVPVGSDTALFNIYLYGTGLAVPDFGFGAYTGIDGDGFPYVVLPADLDLASDEAVDLMRVTTAHEFFHAIEMKTGAYDAAAGSTGYWYWEASADWMAVQVWPQSPVARDYLPFYLLAPHVGIESVVFPDADEFEPIMLHHYGAALLPVYLSEVVADRSLVLESWTTAAPADAPLAVLAALLAQREVDLDEVFADFAAANALLDYPDRALIEAAIDKTRAAYPDYDHRVAAQVAGEEADVAAPPATLPEAWAYNVVEIEDAGSADISIAADPLGSKGTAAHVLTRILRDEDTTRVIVVSTPERSLPGETFAYRIALTPPPDQTEPPADDDDGGCSAAGGCGPLAALLVALALLGASRAPRPAGVAHTGVQ